VCRASVFCWAHLAGPLEPRAQSCAPPPTDDLARPRQLVLGGQHHGHVCLQRVQLLAPDVPVHAAAALCRGALRFRGVMHACLAAG
jgi:hypothetical protein